MSNKYNQNSFYFEGLGCVCVPVSVCVSLYLFLCVGVCLYMCVCVNGLII